MTEAEQIAARRGDREAFVLTEPHTRRRNVLRVAGRGAERTR